MFNLNSRTEWSLMMVMHVNMYNLNFVHSDGKR